MNGSVYIKINMNYLLLFMHFIQKKVSNIKKKK